MEPPRTAVLEDDSVELILLHPEEAHVDAFRRSRDDPGMPATGYYGQCPARTAARERNEARQDPDDPSAPCAVRAEDGVVGWSVVANGQADDASERRRVRQVGRQRDTSSRGGEFERP